MPSFDEFWTSRRKSILAKPEVSCGWIKSTSGAKSKTRQMTALTPKSAKYEPLRSLCDLKTTRDLTNDGVRDLLRRYTRDHGLEVVRLGALEDMSGLNDAFNRYRLFDN